MNHLKTLTLMSALAISTAYPAFAQSGLENLFNRAMASEPAQNTANMPEMSDVERELDEQINNRLRSIVGRMSSQRPLPTSDTLTIEDLDGLRREAERANANKELREAEFAEIQAELEMLTIFMTTLREITDMRNGVDEESAAAAEQNLNVEELRAQWEAEKAAEAATLQAAAGAKEEDETSLIPRLVSIRGAGGNFEAEIESVRGILQFVEPGDPLADGFVLESIDTKGVVIKHMQTENRYSLIPSTPLPPPPEEPEEPGMAQDLGVGGGMF